MTPGDVSVTGVCRGTLASDASVPATGASNTTRSWSSIVVVPSTRRSHGTNTASDPGRLNRLAFAWTRYLPAGRPSVRTVADVGLETVTSPASPAAYPCVGPPRSIGVSCARHDD